jgi:hypothetical protein
MQLTCRGSSRSSLEKHDGERAPFAAIRKPRSQQPSSASWSTRSILTSLGGLPLTLHHSSSCVDHKRSAISGINESCQRVAHLDLLDCDNMSCDEAKPVSRRLTVLHSDARINAPLTAWRTHLSKLPYVANPFPLETPKVKRDTGTLWFRFSSCQNHLPLR